MSFKNIEYLIEKLDVTYCQEKKKSWKATIIMAADFHYW